ncbi:Ras-related protein Rab-40C [Sciurus carolinensis]|uniref:small monomeric GTPase n=2 Tax=Rodentia TaxID=9989 RepID=A0AA41MX06_SCICA|nr:Ras-related protein Rab-40C [Sciurus carolinensis]
MPSPVSGLLRPPCALQLPQAPPTRPGPARRLRAEKAAPTRGGQPRACELPPKSGALAEVPPQNLLGSTGRLRPANPANVLEDALCESQRSGRSLLEDSVRRRRRWAAAGGRMGSQGSPVKSYDYLLKFLLVCYSSPEYFVILLVCTVSILTDLLASVEPSEERQVEVEGIDYKTTTILLDGRRVKLELWDTSGQGRFCTIFRSYSRGAQGILLVYDITNRWSFDGIDRWIKEIDEHAPGVPRILVGNRLHLAFKRQVPTEQARAYAEKNCMTFFEVSPLCNFNVIESFTELSRIVLMRHGMEKIWRPNRVFSLQDLCCRAIVSCTPVHLIDKLPLPVTIKSHLKSFSMANGMNAVMMHGRSYSLASGAGGSSSKGNSLKRSKSIRPPQSPPQNCSRSNCKIS